MKSQTDKSYNPIGMSGCYFMSLAHKVEIITGKKFTQDTIMKVYAECVCTTLMTPNCYILKPGKVASLMCYELNRDTSIRISYIGWWNKDKYGGTPEMWTPESPSFEVKRYRTRYGNHFVLDEYNPDPSLELLELTGGRYFKVRGTQ